MNVLVISSIIQRTRNAISFIIPGLMLLSLVLLLKTGFLEQISPELELALTLDFLLTIPMVHFLLIRKTKQSKITVYSYFIIGLVMASVLMPQENQFYLSHFKTIALPIIELVVMFLVGRKLVQLRRNSHFQNKQIDFYTKLSLATKEVLPKRVAPLFITEIGMLYYAFFVWKQRTLNSGEYTYYKKADVPLMLGVISFVILLETFIFHLLLQNWSLVFAWILTGLSLYTFLQVIAIAKSIKRRPIILRTNSIYIPYGIMSEIEISYSEIESITYETKGITMENLVQHISPLKDLEKYNVQIELKNSKTILNMYGFKRKVKTLVFHIDEIKKFAAELTHSTTNL